MCRIVRSPFFKQTAVMFKYVPTTFFKLVKPPCPPPTSQVPLSVHLSSCTHVCRVVNREPRPPGAQITGIGPCSNHLKEKLSKREPSTHMTIRMACRVVGPYCGLYYPPAISMASFYTTVLDVYVSNGMWGLYRLSSQLLYI